MYSLGGWKCIYLTCEKLVTLWLILKSEMYHKKLVFVLLESVHGISSEKYQMIMQH